MITSKTLPLWISSKGIKAAYLAGPMRGRPLLNFPAFHEGAAYLRRLGLKIVSPAEKDIDAGYSSSKQRPWIECACEDAMEVLKSDAVIVLPGWESSRGTRFEVMAAQAADQPIPIIDFETLTLITDPLQRIVNSQKTPVEIPTGSVRTFETGATRNLSQDKFDYDGFLSPLALDMFAGYMHKHRFQADGNIRASDNWQKGIPLTEYVKSTWRHFVHLWRLHRGYGTLDEKGTPVTMEDTLAALMFNVQGYAHEYLKAKEALKIDEFLPDIQRMRRGGSY